MRHVNLLRPVSFETVSIFAQFRQLGHAVSQAQSGSQGEAHKIILPARRTAHGKRETKFEIRFAFLCSGGEGEMVRFKHRYLLVSLVFPSTLPNPLAASPVVPLEKQPFINESGLISLLRDSLSVNFGDVGAGEVGGSFSSQFTRFPLEILELTPFRQQ